MAEDMASNGNDAQRHYQDAIQAQLGERVTNLGRRVTDIEGEMRAGTVTRAEWQERNRARDQEVTELGRRVDEVRADVGAVYGTRDVIQDMKSEIDRLRQRLNERASP